MKLCRFLDPRAQARVGLIPDDQHVIDLSAAGLTTLGEWLAGEDPLGRIRSLETNGWPRLELSEVRLLPPVDQQEVWAAGVTYLRSKKARMEESDFSATAYDRVYEAARPELFFKALGEKVVGPGDAVGIRRDARWSAPEPELALVLDARGRVVGFTIGNDMSSRDLEGENLLYLPQAKIYERSCALGPWIVVSDSEETARGWRVGIEILRGGQRAFCGETSVSQIKRGFGELAEYLFRSQRFPRGAVLLTGTGVVPGEDFTLQTGDQVSIEISGIGVLVNAVATVLSFGISACKPGADC